MKYLFLVTLAFLLSACGGGSSSPAPIPVVIDEDANGIWEGTFTEGAAAAASITGLLYEGTIIALSTEAGAIYQGTYSVVGDNFTASVTIYQIGGTVLGTASLVGVVTEQSQISLTYTTSYGSSGSISIFYDNIYERDSSFTELEGGYVVTDAGYILGLNILGDGGFTGLDSDGCQIDGNFLIPDTNFNLYTVTASISLCGVANGSYTGFAGLSDQVGFGGANNVLTVALTNDNYVLVSSLLACPPNTSPIPGLTGGCS